MLSKLKSGRAQANKEQLRDMLDSMPVGVMTCDLDTFTIDYANATTIESLKRLEEHLPCKAEEIVGQCIDIFHEDPAHQRALVAIGPLLVNAVKRQVEPERLLVKPVPETIGQRVLRLGPRRYPVFRRHSARS